MRLQSPTLWPNWQQLAPRMGWSQVSGSFRPARGAADGVFGLSILFEVPLESHDNTSFTANVHLSLHQYGIRLCILDYS